MTPGTDGGVDGGEDGGDAGPVDPTPDASVRLPEDTTLFVSRIGDGRGSLELVYTKKDGTPVTRESTETFSEIVLEGTQITLKAIPEPGSRFEGWVGAECTVTGEGCTFTVKSLSYVTARFARAVTLTLAVEGDGTGTVRSEPTGLSCPGSCEAEFSSGSEVRLIPEPAEDSLFAGWSGACVGDGSCVVPLNEGRSVTARFMPRVRLSVSKTGLGNGTISSTPAGLECGPTCEADFVGGSTVRLSASADATSIFVGWSGDCTGMGACVIPMDGSKTATANFQGTFRLTVVKQGGGQGEVTGAPAGIACGESCSFNHPENAEVTLTATAAQGSVFSGWGGACTGAQPTCTVTLNQVRNVIARFVQVFQLTVATGGDGAGTVTSLPSGIDCGATCSFIYTAGTNVSLTATPAPLSIFSHWTGACTGSTACLVSISNATNVTAHFKALLPVTVTKTGAGAGGRLISNPAGIDCGAGCSTASARFPSATEVRILNTNLPGSRLYAWGGACAHAKQTDTSCVLPVAADKSGNVEVEYRPTYVLTLTKTGAGVGTVTSEPVGLACGDANTSCTADFFNEAVKLKAVPSTVAKSVFGGWTGCASQETVEGEAIPRCVVTMNAAKTVNANFLAGHELTVQRGGTTSGGDVKVASSPAGMDCTLKSTSSTGCRTIFKEGEQVTLTATFPPNLAFTGWTCPSSQAAGCPCSGTGASCTVPVTSSRTLIANVQPLMTLTMVKQGTGSAVIKTPTGEVLCAAGETTCSKSYPSGTEVKLSVDPDAKTSFNGWSADACASSTAGFSDCTLTMSGARTATARIVEAWPRRFGAIKVNNNAGTEDVRALATDSGGNIVIGGQIGGLVDFGGAAPVGDVSRAVGFLAKYAADGTHLWSRTLSNPGGESKVNAVVVDAIGDVVAVGFFAGGSFGDGQGSTPLGSNDGFVAKYNGATGAVKWARFVSTGAADDLLSVALDSNGNVIAAGHVAITTTGTAIERPAQVGLPATLPGTDEDAVIVKYTATGDVLAAKRLNGVGLSAARAVTVDGDNIVFVGGTFNGVQTLGSEPPVPGGQAPTFTASGRDAFLLQLAPTTLEVATVKQYGNASGTTDESVEGLAYMGTGSAGIAMIGSYSGTMNIGSNALTNAGFANTFLARVQTGDLNAAWAKGFGATPSDVSVDAAGNILVAGAFSVSVNPTGAQTLVAFNSQDGFVSRFDGNGGAGTSPYSARFGATGVDRAVRAVASGTQVVILGDFTGPLLGTNALATGKDLYARDGKDGFLHVVTP